MKKCPFCIQKKKFFRKRKGVVDIEPLFVVTVLIVLGVLAIMCLNHVLFRKFSYARPIDDVYVSDCFDRCGCEK